MNGPRISRLGFALLLVGGLALSTLPARAADLKPMDDRVLQQTVLRQQFPTTLGAWQQYMYFADTTEVPTVCYSATGEQMPLPKPLNMGGVNYQVDQFTNGSVSIYQYTDQASADAALKALRALNCPGKAAVVNESMKAVPADQSLDYTNATMNGVSVNVSYVDDGKKALTSTITTVVGLAAVQTQVRAFPQKKLTAAKARALADQIGKVNKKWHRRVLDSYKSFGIEGRAR